MSSDISRIIKVNISRQARAVSQKGFGTALLLGQDAEKPGAFTTRTRVYFDLDAVLEDFAATTQVYLAAQAYFGQSIKPEKLTVGFKEGVETVADALGAIKDENDDWYAVAMISTLQSDQEALGAYIAADCRIAGVRSSDAVTKGTALTDIGGVLQANNYERIFTVYDGDSYDSVADSGTEYPEFALLGRILPELPGSVTWAFKELSGVSVESFTGTELTNLLAKNVNFFHRVASVPVTENGQMASGIFIDLIRGSDFIQARMEEAIFARLVNSKKIPFTNPGVDIIVNEMEAVLQRAVEINGILRADPRPTINKPNVRDIPFNDRASRCLPDLTFTGEFAGAVHKVCILGNISV